MINAKKILSVFLIGVLAIGLLGLWPVQPSYAAPYSYQSLTEVPDGYVAVRTVEDLVKIGDQPTGNFILMNDIDLTDYTSTGKGWNPIGTSAKPFNGIFDGNGYQIKGLRMVDTTFLGWPLTAGLFGYVADGSVSNLTLDASFEVNYTSSYSYVVIGGLVGQSKKLTISNCVVNIKATAKGALVIVGGLTGFNSSTFDNFDLTGKGGFNESAAETVVIKDCQVNGSLNVNGGSSAVGGLVGYGRYLFANGSVNNASITITFDSPDNYHNSGGIAGASRAYIIDSCTNNGSISGGLDAAGILCDSGALKTTNVGTEPKNITNCINNGVIDGISTAGILYREDFTSYPLSEFTIGNCANYGTILGNVASGILTCMNNGIVERCYNTGRIVGTESATGIASKNVYGNISECYNVGILESEGNAGGIAVMNLDLIDNCYNAGQVSGNCAAGLSLYNSSYALINNCYNVGGVESTSIAAAGIAGQNDAIVGNTYYYENTATGVAQNDIVGIDESEKIYLADLDEQTTFEGFDFGDGVPAMASVGGTRSTAAPTNGIWEMSSVSGLPVLSGVPEVYISGISIAKAPIKTTYLVNESISTSGLVIKVVYSNGKVVYITKGMAFSTYAKSAGTRNVTVGYGGKTATFPVTFTTFKADSYSYNIAKVSWTAITGATSYKIYRATTATGTYSLIATASGSARSYINSGLATGKTYYYKIRPMYGTRYGSLSSYRTARPIPATPPTATVSKLSNGITLTWGTVGGAGIYEVYRATGILGPYTLVKSTSTKTFTYATLKHGNTYYYVIRAYHTEGTIKVYGTFCLPKKVNW